MSEIIKNRIVISKNSSQAILDIFLKDSSLWDWNLYLNNHTILSFKKIVPYLNLWKEALSLILNFDKVFRVLIVGGGNQLLSNYVLNFPSNITVLDPLCFDYLNSELNTVLSLTDGVNIQTSDELDTRKLCLLDMTLEEAIEDECFELEEFDLVIVDNFIDNLYERSGMYSKHIPKIYYDLIKDKGFLVINQKFSIKKITSKSLTEYPSETIKIIKQNNKYYTQYLNNLNNLLCETDFLSKHNQRVAVYSKVFTGGDLSQC